MKRFLVAFAVLTSLDLGSSHFHEEQTLDSDVSQFFTLGQAGADMGPPPMLAPSLAQQPQLPQQPQPELPRAFFQPAVPINVAPVSQPMLPPPAVLAMMSAPPTPGPTSAPPTPSPASNQLVTFKCPEGNGATFQFHPSSVGWFQNRLYLKSWADRGNAQKNWVEAGNTCRSLCMDLVSLDSPGETEFVASFLNQADVYGVWTSGRVCDFGGCEDPKFQPPRINGWVWASKGIKIGGDPGGRWSNTGASGKPQPDNYIGSKGGENENCVALLANWYNDGNFGFHDMPCSESLPFVCEQR